MNLTIEKFIHNCQVSSHNAYESFKQLLNELENPESRAKAVEFLFALKKYTLLNQTDECYFQFLEQNVLDHYDQTITLDLLQFPSTFLPEAWSFTFYEGLIRYPANEYHNKKVIELGCGIGWISIALALRYLPECMIGLDINPKAIVCARLNLYLNAFQPNGEIKNFANGRTLLNMIDFYESNLFSHFSDYPITVDRIIGCIPQVLNPEPEVMEHLIAETSSDEYLYSLSNYFAKQGFIEDQFGLGLIASAVEQSIGKLKPDGKLILNLGGRPGRKVLERLMQRRGFKVRRIWQTQVEQAADTEINALVDIEKSTGHRFEFYMSASSDIPIDARTALQYANAGGKIYHSVDVYEATMLLPEKVKTIYQAIDQFADSELKSAVDLTYDSFEDADERYSFLAFLAKQIQQLSHFPYEDTAGLNYFRQQLAEYFRYYLQVDISEKQVLITPSRRELIESLLTNYRPRLTLVSKNQCYLIGRDFDQPECEIIQVPSQVEYLIELIKKLQPQCVITQIDAHEIQSGQLVQQLIHCAVEHQVLLLLDLTDNIDLSSQPEIHGVYRYLSEHTLPNNLIIMAGLINNRVYQDYTLNITLTSNDFIAKHLIDAAELTYSRTPFLKQLYYAHLLEELLFFQRTRKTTVMENKAVHIAPALPLALCQTTQKAFGHPAIQGNHLNFTDNTIRLDYGENELAVPEVLKEALFESYLVRRCVGDDASPEEPLQQLLSERFNFSPQLFSMMLFGNGVAPIFAALLTLCAREKKKLLIPSGSYGYFRAAAEYKGIDVIVIETFEKDNFKLTPEQLNSTLAQHADCWLFLNAPVVNPTGAIYGQQEMSNLLSIAAERGVTVIMDSIFCGLEFSDNLRWDLADSIERFNATNNARFILLGGISKEFAAGGLRFGYCWSTSRALLQSLQPELPHIPHFTLKYAIRKLIRLQLSLDSSLLAHLQWQKDTLFSRAKQLSAVLTQRGWQVIMPQGGLFLVAKPQQKIDLEQLPLTEGGDKVTELLFQQSNVAINNSTWTGLPGYCRFVLSGSENDFQEGIKRLSQF
ncbi:aminotransferase class I/II-fold pyridoxal phosphate-dependent enzyme [Aliikangiella maris]|uniref:Aminotransferase class I/II-fold pyridoxal phosphate-dependent enzyme n=2 Tax=Aliikangiella maris TaxID=3162458 RepID=A0ABV3MT85_9GAMM